MAVDWGERRIGIALSDESRAIASPYGVVKRGGSLDKDLERISAIARENSVSLVVFGLPVRLDGSLGPEASGVLEVVEKLRQKVEMPVKTWDERLSTVEAQRVLINGNVSREKRRGLVDQIAAAIFLQGYLDSLSGKAL